MPKFPRRVRVKLRRTRRKGNAYLYVAVHKGYITISEGDYDHPDFRPIYIPRDQLIPLLQWLIPLARKMGDSHDPVLAAREQEELSDAIKRQRSALRRSPRRRRRSP